MKKSESFQDNFREVTTKINTLYLLRQWFSTGPHNTSALDANQNVRIELVC